jgi:YcxB-like protein
LFTLSYRLEKQHRNQFNIAARRRVLGWWRYVYYVAAYLAMVASILFLGLCGRHVLDVKSAFAGMFAYIYLIWFVQFLYVKLYAHLSVRDNGSTLGERQLRASDQALDVAGPHFRESIDWQAVEGITERKSILVLWTDRSAGYIVPKAAFKTQEQLRAFQDFVGAKIDSAWQRDIENKITRDIPRDFVVSNGRSEERMSGGGNSSSLQAGTGAEPIR